MWASESFKENLVNSKHSIGDAINLAREADSETLFLHSIAEIETSDLSIRRGAVAATAAIVLNFRSGRTQEDLEWARNTLGRAILLPEMPDLFWAPNSVIPWHQAIYVARGLAADIRFGTAAPRGAGNLLELIAHPLEIVSSAALEEACKLWDKDQKLTWAALILALSLCHIPKRPLDQFRKNNEPIHSSSERQSAIDTVLKLYENESGWAALPLPPPAWVKFDPEKTKCGRRINDEYDEFDLADTTEVWGEPDISWNSQQAAEILKCIPLEEILASSAKCVLLDFLANVLDWTIQKNAPPWVKSGRRVRTATSIFQWTHALGSTLGKIAGLIPLRDFQPRFLSPILELEGDNCWALMSPFASTYVCSYVYDATVVPADAVATLDLCLSRLLLDSAFKRDGYRSGEFSGFDQPELVRTLMFVSVERADMSARYVNGNWTEINLILPIVDRFVRAGGWAVSVLDPFLTLCERAKSTYPAESFADQILEAFGKEPENLKGWHGTFIPARIAELIQHFAHRDAPMSQNIGQKFLKILDLLVDMGDRRSAALQLGVAFRETQLPT